MTLQEKFIAKLETKYGPWNKVTSRFGSSSFGDISKALSISASQFSKLISGTATEGMYSRSIENIDRLIVRENIRQELSEVLEENNILEKKLETVHKSYKSKFIYIGLLSLLLGGLLSFFLWDKVIQKNNDQTESLHPLSRFFDKEFNAEFKSPYLDISEIQDYCPCSAYEGIWSLPESYKIPMPGTRKPGVYYIAKSADVRMKCSKNDSFGLTTGNALLAYEYLINEIWVDTKMTPLSPTYFDKETKQFTAEYDNLVFENNPQFKKVATIHSFFIDKFEIHDDHIIRTGEPCGRYASDIDKETAALFEIDIKYILENILGNLVTTNCESTPNPYCDPNDLKEGESIISFDCLYTIETENLGIGGGYPYQKGYKLEKQNYSDNLTCHCD